MTDKESVILYSIIVKISSQKDYFLIKAVAGA